ncbi:unnamed protein product [Nezara viridula]|uniref:Uncharacterized protein n=1 Tax=Nezara viridula TaxID=85310 RepID=A0A9P0MVF7_NEZVI|nr:unnamed protein product [Nezara viridula]
MGDIAHYGARGGWIKDSKSLPWGISGEKGGPPMNNKREHPTRKGERPSEEAPVGGNNTPGAGIARAS